MSNTIHFIYLITHYGRPSCAATTEEGARALVKCYGTGYATYEKVPLFDPEGYEARLIKVDPGAKAEHISNQ